MDCNFDGVYKFPGMIVFDGDIRLWMGMTEKGLDDYIKYATDRGEDLTTGLSFAAMSLRSTKSIRMANSLKPSATILSGRKSKYCSMNC